MTEAKADAAAAQAELATTRSKAETAQSDLAKAKSEAEMLRTELAKTKEQADAANAELEKMRLAKSNSLGSTQPGKPATLDAETAKITEYQAPANAPLRLIDFKLLPDRHAVFRVGRIAAIPLDAKPLQVRAVVVYSKKEHDPNLIGMVSAPGQSFWTTMGAQVRNVSTLYREVGEKKEYAGARWWTSLAECDSEFLKKHDETTPGQERMKLRLEHYKGFFKRLEEKDCQFTLDLNPLTIASSAGETGKGGFYYLLITKARQEEMANKAIVMELLTGYAMIPNPN